MKNAFISLLIIALVLCASEPHLSYAEESGNNKNNVGIDLIVPENVSVRENATVLVNVTNRNAFPLENASAELDVVASTLYYEKETVLIRPNETHSFAFRVFPERKGKLIAFAMLSFVPGSSNSSETAFILINRTFIAGPTANNSVNASGEPASGLEGNADATISANASESIPEAVLEALNAVTGSVIAKEDNDSEEYREESAGKKALTESGAKDSNSEADEAVEEDAPDPDSGDYEEDGSEPAENHSVAENVTERKAVPIPEETSNARIAIATSVLLAVFSFSARKILGKA